MRPIILTAAAAALAAVTITAEAQGNGNGNGPGARGNGHGQAGAVPPGQRDGGPGRGNRNGNGPPADRDTGPPANRGNGPPATRDTGPPANRGGPDERAARDGPADLRLLPGPRSDDPFGVSWNCPPGLARKDPPCVPPGLAREGITADDWATWEPRDFDRLIDDWRRIVLGDESGARRPVARDTWLTQSELIDIFGLDPLPDDRRYAVIDGQVVALDSGDYALLRTLRGLAPGPEPSGALRVAPQVALTSEELAAIYGLPAPREGRRYSVVNGEILDLATRSYGLLQLIRAANAVF